MRKLCLFLLSLFLAIPAIAQGPPTAPTLTAGILNLKVYTLNAVPLSGANIVPIGVAGQQFYCYWAVANYQIGSVMSSLGCTNTGANTLSGSNYNQITPYSYPAGMTSADFLRTTTNVAPSGACNCAVATGVTSGSVNDQSNSLNSYTVTLVDPNTFNLTLTNEVVGTGASHLILRQGVPGILGTEIADLSTAGASAVTSVFGRTGAVTAQTGDYTLSQIGNPTSTKTFALGSFVLNFTVSSTGGGIHVNDSTSAGAYTASTSNAATSGANFNSPSFVTSSSYWTGSAAAANTWALNDVLGSGANPTTTLTLSQTGSSGLASLNFPYPLAVTGLSSGCFNDALGQGPFTLSCELFVTNCTAAGSAANPSVVACPDGPAAGTFSCATNASAGTCVVQTTKVDTSSRILITSTTATGSSLGVTCNTTSDAPTSPRVASISSGVSFTINLGTFTTNPECFYFWITN